MLIACEGVDACGKNTHTQLIAQKLDGVVIDFPHYSTVVGKLIKDNLTGFWTVHCDYDPYEPCYDSPDVNALVLQYLMFVNRAEMVPQIKHYLDRNRTVILDRYYASGMVYGKADGLGEESLKSLETIHALLPQPDLWLLLDITAEESVRRRPERRDRYEKTPGLMEKVRAGYLQLFADKKSLGNWVVVDGMGEKEEVHTRLMSAIADAKSGV